jgi:hypothetical protein
MPLLMDHLATKVRKQLCKPADHDSVVLKEFSPVLAYGFILRGLFDSHFRKKTIPEDVWEQTRASRSYEQLLRDIGVIDPSLILNKH